jgi:hypothetical protein
MQQTNSMATARTIAIFLLILQKWYHPGLAILHKFWLILFAKLQAKETKGTSQVPARKK